MEMQNQDAALVTKADLNHGIHSLRHELIIEIIKTNGRIDRLEKSLKDQMGAETSKILKVVEDFATKCEKVDHDQIITRYRVDELKGASKPWKPTRFRPCRYIRA